MFVAFAIPASTGTHNNSGLDPFEGLVAVNALLSWGVMGANTNPSKGFFMHEIPKQDIKNEQLLRLALHQATNLVLSGSDRKHWFKQAVSLHKMRSFELVELMERSLING